MSLATSPVGVLYHAGYSLAEIGSWTFYQVRMMIADDREMGGRVGSLEEGRTIRDQRRTDRERFVENLMRSRVWRGPLGG